MKRFKALLFLFFLYLLSSQTAFGQYSISGDLSGTVYTGFAVTLQTASNRTFVERALTGSSGNYIFPDVPNGDYRLITTTGGYTSCPGFVYVTVADSNVSNVDFLSLVTSELPVIRGTVTEDGTGLSGVTINQAGDCSQEGGTNVTGEYNLPVKDGNYTITPSKAGYTFAPENATVTVAGSDVSSVDFVATADETSTCTGNFVIDWIETSNDIAALSGCTEIDGYLYIESTDLTSLTGLEGLTSVSGAVDIYNNPQLTSLNALNNLTSVDALRIRDNNALTSLSGLNNITSVRNLEISRNNVLTSLNGLEGITSVSNYILISWNDVLTNLCALNNVILSGNELHIYENLLLSMATANALETQLRSNGFSGTNVNIHSNDGLELVTCDGCADGDADSVCDDEDNCPNNANPNQEDADGDTMGDVCDSDTIYGTISGDIQEDVTVYLYILNCGATQPHATAITDVQGYYSAGDLPIGRYAIYIAEPGYSFAPKGYWADIPNEPGQSYDSTATADLQ
jgi:hypothetical protein